MSLLKWADRTFFFGYPESHFPFFAEKLEAIAPRIEELVKDVPENILEMRKGGHWSVKDHIGHLSDLEELNEGRVLDFKNGLNTLRAADMSNKKTEDAHHNTRPIQELITEFREKRAEFIKHLNETGENTRTHISLHPRLKKQITLTDLLYFIGEHDNQHLTTIAFALAARG